jgi:hypothetical protein
LFNIDSAAGAIDPARHGGNRVAVAFEQDAPQSLAQNLLQLSVQWKILAAAASDGRESLDFIADFSRARCARRFDAPRQHT